MQKEEKQSLKKTITCSFCGGTDIIKRGIRKKKLERVQIYYCKKCDKRFTPYITKHRTYPLRIILEVLTQYNRLKYKNEIISYISQIYGITISEKNISNWITDFSEYIPFLRLPKYIKLKYDRRKIIQESKMFHRQIYHFMYHPAKLKTLLFENYRNSKIAVLKDFLELVIPECPHQIFKEDTERASALKKEKQPRSVLHWNQQRNPDRILPLNRVQMRILP